MVAIPTPSAPTMVAVPTPVAPPMVGHPHASGFNDGDCPNSADLILQQDEHVDTLVLDLGNSDVLQVFLQGDILSALQSNDQVILLFFLCYNVNVN